MLFPFLLEVLAGNLWPLILTLIASWAKPFGVTITLVTYILSDQETCVQIENSNNQNYSSPWSSYNTLWLHQGRMMIDSDGNYRSACKLSMDVRVLSSNKNDATPILFYTLPRRQFMITKVMNLEILSWCTTKFSKLNWYALISSSYENCTYHLRP